MKHLIMVCLFCLGLSQINCANDANKNYLDTQNSGCLGDMEGQAGPDVNIEDPDVEMEESIKWTYHAPTLTLTVIHYNVSFNCCPAGIRSFAEIDTETYQIELWEEEYFDFEDMCACDCLYNVTSPIPNLFPGTFHLTVYTNEQKTYEETITLQQ